MAKPKDVYFVELKGAGGRDDERGVPFGEAFETPMQAMRAVTDAMTQAVGCGDSGVGTGFDWQKAECFRYEGYETYVTEGVRKERQWVIAVD